MTQEFNPYYEWLGIPPKDQPPNHYRLLGIELFEASRSVIDTAANRQMSFLKEYQAGEHSELTQRLLNELAAARLCLLNKEKKAAYDEAPWASLNAREVSARPPPLRQARKSDEATEVATGQGRDEGMVALRVPMTPPLAAEPILPPIIEERPVKQGAEIPLPERTPIFAESVTPVFVKSAVAAPQSRTKGVVFGLALGLASVALVTGLVLWAASVIGVKRGSDRDLTEVQGLGDASSVEPLASQPRSLEPRKPSRPLSETPVVVQPPSPESTRPLFQPAMPPVDEDDKVPDRPKCKRVERSHHRRCSFGLMSLPAASPLVRDRRKFHRPPSRRGPRRKRRR